jgi:hypothetical protein
MIATTTAPFGEQKQTDILSYRLCVFTWHTDVFYRISRVLEINFKKIEDDDFPSHSIFRFHCDVASLLVLIRAYISAGHPFDLTNQEDDPRTIFS